MTTRRFAPSGRTRKFHPQLIEKSVSAPSACTPSIALTPELFG
jgi:hypothetical protein